MLLVEHIADTGRFRLAMAREVGEIGRTQLVELNKGAIGVGPVDKGRRRVAKSLELGGFVARFLLGPLVHGLFISNTTGALIERTLARHGLVHVAVIVVRVDFFVSAYIIVEVVVLIVADALSFSLKQKQTNSN